MHLAAVVFAGQAVAELVDHLHHDGQRPDGGEVRQREEVIERGRDARPLDHEDAESGQEDDKAQRHARPRPNPAHPPLHADEQRIWIEEWDLQKERLHEQTPRRDDGPACCLHLLLLAHTGRRGLQESTEQQFIGKTSDALGEFIARLFQRGLRLLLEKGGPNGRDVAFAIEERGEREVFRWQAEVLQ